MANELKIETPYGQKNWSFVKQVFDSHNELVEACKAVLKFTQLLSTQNVQKPNKDLLCSIGHYADAHSARLEAVIALAEGKKELCEFYTNEWEVK